jgi:hypothetical protein
MSKLPAINSSILSADEIRKIADYLDAIESVDYLPKRLFDAVMMGVAYSGLRSRVYHLERNPASKFILQDLDYLACSDSKITTYVFVGMYLSKYRARKEPIINEKKYHSFIVDNFYQIFVDYEFIKNEFALSGEDRDRIDILAKEKSTGRPVIIELKLGDISAHKQLRSYAYHFDNPILINVSERLPRSMREGVIYRTYGGLGIESTPVGQLKIAELWGAK